MTSEDRAQEYGLLIDRAISAAKINVAADLPLSAIQRLWLSHEVVAACWPETRERVGHGFLILKGAGRAREIADSGKSLWANVTGFMCLGYEHAVVIQRTLEAHRDGRLRAVPITLGVKHDRPEPAA
jgi:hypothetical protein